MYPVSQDYLNIITSNSKQSSLRGTITFKNGSTEDLTMRNIAAGSVSIEKNCLESDSLEFGGVLLGTLNIGLRTNRSRYLFYGARIILTYSLLLDETTDTWEDVPLGTYVVSDAETTDNVVSLTAYDNLKLLDKKIGAFTINANPYDLLSTAAHECGIELGFEATDIADWVNSDFVFQLSTDSGCDTYRDMVKIVCQTMGAFAYASRDGKLMVRQFNESPIRTLDVTDRYSLVIADYRCFYSSLTLTSLKGTYSTQGERSDGIAMVIEDAPAWDYGATEFLQVKCDDLFNYLEGITYTPFQMTMPNDPSWDCGDWITLKTDKGDVETLITNYTWSFANTMEVNSEGTNPYLSEISEVNSESARINSTKTKYAEMVVYEFTNPHEVELTSEFQEVALCRFITTMDTFLVFAGTIQVVSDLPYDSYPVVVKNNQGVESVISAADGTPLSFEAHTDGSADVDITYSIGGSLLDTIQTERVFDGNHLITLVYPVPFLSGNLIYEWRILMRANKRSVIIPKNTLKGVIFGSGLIKPSTWNGYLYIEDKFYIPLKNGILGKYAETLNLATSDRALTHNLAENAYSLPLNGGMSLAYTENANTRYTMSIKPMRITTEDGQYRIMTEDGQSYIETEE